MEQLTHYNSKFKQQNFPVTVLCENVTNAPNIGALFRMCDAFGVSELIFSGKHVPIPSRKMQKTSRATEKYVPYKIIENLKDYCCALKKTHHLIALEITNTSNAIQNYTLQSKKPLALIIGDENFGISEELLKLSDEKIHIEMFGKNSSMNVVQATNIALYEITKQLSLK